MTLFAEGVRNIFQWNVGTSEEEWRGGREKRMKNSESEEDPVRAFFDVDFPLSGPRGTK